MLRWGLGILGVALVCGLLLAASGGIGSCGPQPGALPFMIGYMITLPLGAILTLIGLIQWAVNRYRHRKENREVPRVTPS